MPTDETEIAKYIDKFNYEISDTTKAHIEGNVIYFNPENITEKCELTVTVSAKYYKYKSEYTTRSFTIKVVNAVAVYNEPQLQKACDQKYNICLMQNVTAIHQEYRLNSDLYGNNFMVFLDLVERPKDNTCLFVVNHDNLISNVTIRSNETDGEMSSEDGAKSFYGGAIQYVWEDHEGTPGYDLRFTSRLEFSTIENCSISIIIFDCDLTIDGCVIRNSSQCALYMKNCEYTTVDGVAYYDYTNLTLNNCIFSNLLGTCCSMDYQVSFFQPDSQGRTLTDNGYVITYDKARNSTFRQTGFCDIYNWQSINDISGLVNGFILEEKYKPIIAALLAQLFDYPDFDKYKYFKGSGSGTAQQYICMGFMSNGLLAPSQLDYSFEDERIKYLDFDDCPSIVESNFFSNLLIENRTYIFVYDGSSTITPDSQPNYDKYTYNRLNPKK